MMNGGGTRYLAGGTVIGRFTLVFSQHQHGCAQGRLVWLPLHHAHGDDGGSLLGTRLYS